MRRRGPAAAAPRCGLFLATLALLAGAAAGAAAPAETAAPLARAHLAGTSLTIVPAIGYEHATLSVSGPDGYAVAREIEAGQPLSIDLFSAAGMSGDRPSSAALKPGVAPQAGWSALPEGQYRYEVVFEDVAGEQRIHSGSFFVEAGAPISREAMRSRRATAAEALGGGQISEPGAAAESTAGSSGVTRSSNMDDFLQIWDTADDHNTHIWMEGDFPTTSNWWLQNDDGDFRFVEFSAAHPLPGITRMTLEGQDLGLGTTAPATDLHIRRDGVTRIFLEDTVAGGDDWGIWNQNPWGLLFGRGSAGFIAPVWLIITPSGDIGMGLDSPAAKLHVAGNAIINGDLSVGSSRASKHDVTRVAGDELLAGLQELAIHSWRYREDPTQARHIGPMAEDFHRLFGVGADSAHLSPTDTGGVALAAVKALHEQLADLMREAAQTHRELDTLRAELAALRALQATAETAAAQGQ